MQKLYKKKQPVISQFYHYLKIFHFPIHMEFNLNVDMHDRHRVFRTVCFVCTSRQINESLILYSLTNSLHVVIGKSNSVEETRDSNKYHNYCCRGHVVNQNVIVAMNLKKKQFFSQANLSLQCNHSNNQHFEEINLKYKKNTLH